MLSSIFYNKINHSDEENKAFQTLSDKLSSKFDITKVSNSFLTLNLFYLSS
jgi:hypothetical protein